MGLSLPALIAVFAAAAMVICLAGSKLAGVAAELASRTGLGGAFFGAVFLGAMTSLPGLTASLVAAAQGRAELAVANAVGGIAAQTMFLVIADAFHRRVNLEHAAASLQNIVYGVVLIGLLALPVLAFAGPEMALAGVHPVSVVMIAAYLGGLHLTRDARAAPMWRPRENADTQTDAADEGKRGGATTSLWAAFAALAAVTLAAGYAVAAAGETLVTWYGFSETAVGVFFTAIATSTPELVTTIAAVRRGALTLAVGAILGGNAFDVLFIAGSDIAFRDGSIFHAISAAPVFWLMLAVAMTATLLLGLLSRERKGGPANVGFEGVIVFALYAAGVAMTLV